MTQRAYTLSSVAVVLSLIAISAAFYTALTPVTHIDALAEDNTNKNNMLVVSGVGEVGIKPDRAKILLGAFTEADNVQKAVEENAEIFQKILQSLQTLGIDKENIETISYNISPIYQYPRDSKPVLVGFRVDHRIAVIAVAQKIDQLGKEAGRVIDAAVSAGANELMSIYFTVSDGKIKELKNKALEDAVLDAKAKAQIMADALDVEILGVQQVNESPVYYPPVPMYAREFGAAEVMKAPTEVVPSELKISVSVQVTFIIG